MFVFLYDDQVVDCMLSDEGFSSGIFVASMIKRVVGYFVSKHTGMSLSICMVASDIENRNAKSEICKPSHNRTKHRNDSSIGGSFLSHE